MQMEHLKGGSQIFPVRREVKNTLNLKKRVLRRHPSSCGPRADLSQAVTLNADQNGSGLFMRGRGVQIQTAEKGDAGAELLETAGWDWAGLTKMCPNGLAPARP